MIGPLFRRARARYRPTNAPKPEALQPLAQLRARIERARAEVADMTADISTGGGR